MASIRRSARLRGDRPCRTRRHRSSARSRLRSCRTVLAYWTCSALRPPDRLVTPAKFLMTIQILRDIPRHPPQWHGSRSIEGKATGVSRNSRVTASRQRARRTPATACAAASTAGLSRGDTLRHRGGSRRRPTSAEARRHGRRGSEKSGAAARRTRRHRCRPPAPDECRRRSKSSVARLQRSDAFLILPKPR